jgi:hypothetical protein
MMAMYLPSVLSDLNFLHEGHDRIDYLVDD